MDDLWSIIAELGLDLHHDRIATIAAKVETLGSANQFASAKSSFGPNADKDMVARLERAWKLSEDTSPRDVASALRGASAAASLLERRGAVELVWTGPSTGLVPVRHTEQVLCEVIESAKRRLFLVSFVAYEVETITRALRAAIGRDVQVDVLLESSSEHGGKVGYDSVKCMRRLFPSVNLYIWQAGKNAKTTLLTGAVHAKCVVADGELAYITSANITSAAMERNMEVGVLVKGGGVPFELHRHLDALVSTKIIEKVGDEAIKQRKKKGES